MKRRAPVVVRIKGKAGFQRLLDPRNASILLKSGSVVLAPGHDIGVHTTEGKEEFIIILKGKARVTAEGFRPVSVARLSCVYIPARTAHNLTNTGSTSLHYIYVVCPVPGKR